MKSVLALMMASGMAEVTANDWPPQLGHCLIAAIGYFIAEWSLF